MIFTVHDETKCKPFGVEYLITEFYRPTWLGRLFGFRRFERQYFGEGTCWSHYPSGQMCDTDDDERLFAIWQRHQWKGT